MKDSFIANEDLQKTIESLDKQAEKSLFINDEVQNNLNNSKHKNHATKTGMSFAQFSVIGEVKYRWVIFVCFCLLSFSNGMQWVCISSIASNFILAYKVDSIVVDMYSLSYMIVFPFIFPLAAYIIDNKSVKKGIIASAILNIIGVLMKCLINKSFLVALIGQFLSAIAQPFIISASGKISSLWFRAEVRTTITSLLAVSNILGTLFGVIFNVFFVPNELKDVNDYKNAVWYYLGAEAIITFIFTLPTIIFFKSKPRHAPSVSQNNMKVPSFQEAIKILFHDTNFLCLLGVCTIIVGYFNLFGTLLNQILAEYSIDNTNTAIIGGISNILGLVSCIIISIIVDKLKQYKSSFMILAIVGVITQLLITILLEYCNKSASVYIWGVGMTIMMMTCIPFYCIGIDYVCEITYPVGELISGGFILTGSQILGVAEVFLSNYFLKIEKKYLINVMSLVFMAIALCILFFMKEDLKRNKTEFEEPEENSEYEDNKEIYENLEKKSLNLMVANANN